MMTTFLRAFCLGLLLGVPVAFGTWLSCCTTCTVKVAYRAQQPQPLFEMEMGR